MLTKKQAINHLLNIKPETVIDENWFSDLIDKDTLLSLFVTTNLNSYQEILDKYEGYTIDELLDIILNN